MTRAWEVFRFELAYQAGRVSTRIYFALFVAFAVVFAWINLADARNDGFLFNAPIVTALITVMASMFSLLVTAGVAGDAATRDAQLRIEPLLYTTLLGKRSYLGGRFLGAFALTALLLLAVPIVLLATTHVPGLEPGAIGPFRAGAYLTAYFFIAVPNAFVATAVLFALAALTRRALAAYAGAAVLFFGAAIAQAFIGGKLQKWELAKVADPLGFSALLALWRSYNPLQKNTLAVELEGALLSNRLLWVAIAASVLAVAFARFRFAHASGGGSRRTTASDELPEVRWTRVTLPSARRAFGPATRMRQLRAVAIESLRDLHKSRAWWIVPFTAVLFVLTTPQVLAVALGTPGAATTGRVADVFGAGELARLMALLIALSAGELVWRERDARINAIADVAPVPEWVSFLGRFLALGVMLAVAELIFLAAGIVTQARLGHYEFEPGVYLQFLFGFQLAGYLLFAAVAMLIHVLVNQKYVGNVLAVMTYIGLQLAPDLGIEHKLLIYGAAPEPVHTEMGGFGFQREPWLWFTLYWSGWALLSGVAAYLFWMRGEERGLRWRLALARRRITRGPVGVAIAALAIVTGAGGFVFYNTNVLNRYWTDAEVEGQRAEYERRYGRYASLPQPMLAATKLHVDFYPEQNKAAIRGTYRLENRSRVAIDAIHVVANPDVATNGVTFDRPSRPALIDDSFGYRIYALDRPLQPGESVRMQFEVVHAPRGFTNSGWNPSVMANGSWFQHRADAPHGARQWLPFIGYQQNRELHAAAARKRHGLPARPPVPELEDVAARNRQLGRERIDLETIVGTDAGQIGVAPGALRRRWTEGGRHYSHYVTDAPINNTYAIYSARYAVQRARWRDVEIELLHHPPHTRNLGRILDSVRASLEYHTRHYGPYPHKQLRLVQYPNRGGGLDLTSFPGLIEYSDGFALVRPEDDQRGIDLPFAVMAHEMGHQWWGHQLVPARVEGAGIMSESLAWYSAMLVVEQTRGRDHLLRLLDVMRGEYLAPHTTRDVPLLRTRDRIDAYRTGPFAMFAVREAIGADRVNAALRNLLAKFDRARPPYPTSLDLYRELQAAAPPDQRDLLKDLFEEITFWDLRTEKAEVQRAGNAWRVTLQVEARKLKGDALGREKSVPMDDAIEVALLDAGGRTLYRAPHRIRSGEQFVTIDVGAKPTRAAIDPDRELLDRRPEDNATDITEPAQ